MKETKTHILQTAFALFLQKSFKEVTMNEIVTASKLSKGAFYHYFTSKEELFEEVINRFYIEFARVDFSRFSQKSLKDFMDDYQAQMDKAANQVLDGGVASVTMNYFLPMIDALRMLPYFKDKIMEAREREINAWVKVIKAARKKGEIKSAISDQNLAKLFIYIGDGAGVFFMLAGNSGSLGKEVKAVWEDIYAGIKAR